MAIQLTVTWWLWSARTLSVWSTWKSFNGYGQLWEWPFTVVQTLYGIILRINSYIQWPRDALTCAWVRCNCFLTRMRTQIASGWRLARHKDGIPSSRKDSFYSNSRAYHWLQHWEMAPITWHIPGMHNISHARQKSLGNWARQPTHHLIGSHLSRSSGSSLKYSSSSLTVTFSLLL